MRDRLIGLIGTTGLVIALAIVALPTTKLFAGGHTCSPSVTSPCLTNTDGTCKDGALQTGVCVPSKAGEPCSPCTSSSSGGCKCTAM